MKLNKKVMVGSIFATVGGIAFHVISDMFFTSNKIGLAILIIGFCGIAAALFLKEVNV